MEREERQSVERPRPRHVGDTRDSPRDVRDLEPSAGPHGASLEQRAEPPTIETRLKGAPLQSFPDEASNVQVRRRMRYVLLLTLALAFLGALIYALKP